MSSTTEYKYKTTLDLSVCVIVKGRRCKVLLSIILFLFILSWEDNINVYSQSLLKVYYLMVGDLVTT